MAKEEQKQKGEFKVTYFHGKVLSVYRRCSCGGDVEIKVDNETGKSTATCTSCGITLTWSGKE